jgi:lipoprotein-anchoring transpeptidase ErfK/SrfK
MPRRLPHFISILIAASWILAGSAQPAAAQGSTLTHVVQPGETLLDLALFYSTPLHELVALNEADAFPIGSGRELSIPVPFQVIPDIQVAEAVGGPFTYIIQQGDTLLRIAIRFNVSVEALAAVNQIYDINSIYAGQELIIPTDEDITELLANEPASSQDAPPPTEVGGKQIVISLSQQQTYAYENGELVRQFVVSTGLPGTPTVKGNFAIYVKYASQTMSGPGYNLPGVPWVMYFYRSYALHGTYWHNNFGQPMSHGCVNMRTPEAEWLYNWAPIGTPVRVVD